MTELEILNDTPGIGLCLLCNQVLNPLDYNPPYSIDDERGHEITGYAHCKCISKEQDRIIHGDEF